MFDVEGAPLAVPGRTATNPVLAGRTAVTFAVMAVAPTGTTIFEPVRPSGSTTGMVPVIATRVDRPPTSAVERPTPNRLSTTRSGVIATNTAPGDSARTPASPPAPRVTATAAPTAAQRVRSSPRVRRRAGRVVVVAAAISSSIGRSTRRPEREPVKFRT